MFDATEQGILRSSVEPLKTRMPATRVASGAGAGTSAASFQHVLVLPLERPNYSPCCDLRLRHAGVSCAEYESYESSTRFDHTLLLCMHRPDTGSKSEPRCYTDPKLDLF